MKYTVLAPITMILRSCFVAALAVSGVFLVRGAGVLPREAVAAALGGLAVGVLWTYQRALLKQVRPVLLQLFMGVLLALFFAAAVYFQLPRAGDSEYRAIESYLPTTDRSGTILYGRTVSLYAGRHAGSEFRDAVLIRHREIPRLQAHREILWNVSDGLLIVPGSGTIATETITELRERRPPAVFSRLVEDLFHVIAVFDQPLPSGPGIASILALSFVLALVWVAARFSRWPLVNGVLAAGVILLVFAVPRVLDAIGAADLLSERVDVLSAVPLREYLPAGAWVLIGVMLMICAVFQQPHAQWRREMLPPGADS